jgi:NAD(P)-dependent dehydrogenase (short-subunit alcohol dehydrogenase family)
VPGGGASLEEDLSRSLVIGGAGLLGAEVVKALGAGKCVVAMRASGSTSPTASRSPRFLIVSVKSMGSSARAGAPAFKPWDHLTYDDWTFSLANKLMGQINVVRLGANHVRHGVAITLTSGLAAQYPAPGSAIIRTVNAAVEAFVRAVAADPVIAARVNAVSPGWVAETLQAMGRDTAGGIPARDVAPFFLRQLHEGASGSVAPPAKR